jgi:hypothetical protein
MSFHICFCFDLTTFLPDESGNDHGNAAKATKTEGESMNSDATKTEKRDKGKLGKKTVCQA